MLQRALRFLGQQFKLLLLLLLAASFVFWGVADMVMRPAAVKELAMVGSEKITDADFRASYDRMREQYRRSPLTKGLSEEALANMGLPRRVLDGLINDKALQLEAAEHGFTISDKMVADATRKNSAFAGENGFDHKKFEQMIHSIGLTEKSYLQAMKTNEASQQFGFALFGQKLLHPTLLQAMTILRKELRDVHVWVFTQSLKPATATPTEAQLKDYYTAHKAEFQAPEYRTFGLIYFDPKKAAGSEVDEETLRAAYEEQKASFTAPEERAVDQLLYAQEDAAKTASARLKGGEAWEKVAADSSPLNKGGTDLGSVTRAKAVPALKDAIFALKKGETSAPVKSNFGWHVLRLRGITPEHVQDFADVKDKLRETVGKQQSEDTLYHQIDQLENALSSGADFDSAAKAADAKVIRLGPIDAQGLKPDGVSQLGLPKLPDFLSRGFALKEKDTTSALTLPDGRNLVAGVLTITPARARTLEEVKGQVAALWIKENRAKAVQIMADGIAAMTSGAEDKARAAGAFDAPVKGIKRDTQASLRDPAKNVVRLPKEMTDAVFTLREGQHTKSFVLETGDVAFATLEKVHTAPEQLRASEDAKADLDKSRDALNGELGSDFYKLYIEYLRAKHKVRINEDRLSTILKPQATEE